MSPTPLLELFLRQASLRLALRQSIFSVFSRRHAPQPRLPLRTLSQATTSIRSYRSSLTSRMASAQPPADTPGAAETDAKAQTIANTSGITPDSISTTLREKLQAGHVVVEDISGGCGQSFEAVIVSPLFEKKMSLARHRLVNAALKEEIAAIHAWTPKCYTPDEWERRGG